MQSLPFEIFTSDEVKVIESDFAKDNNGHCYDLMLKAGHAVFDAIFNYVERPKEVWVFCGKGNNGGDGYVVANLLLESQIPYRVFAIGVPHEGSEASIAYEYFIKQGGVIEYELPNFGNIDDGIIDFPKPDVIVDALLGTGIESAPQCNMSKWVAFINQLDTFTISVDIPTGVVADTGFVPGVCVCADVTVCMLALKPGLFTSDAVDLVGDIVFAPLDIDARAYYNLFEDGMYRYPLPIVRISYDDVLNQLPVRALNANKGDNGKVLVIAGDVGMGGAAIICGRGALRTGSGLVKVATARENFAPLLSNQAELMTVDLDDLNAVRKAIAWADVVAVGPGLGVTEKSAAILSILDDNEDKVFVYDADALNLLAHYEQNYYKENRVITPHPGEAARLLGCTVDEVNSDRLLACYKLWQKYGGVVLLKGAGTIICNGQRLTIINDGSPALAVGGSGDLLTGVIVSLLGQGLENEIATIVGAAIHARAGKLAGLDGGVIGTLSCDVTNYVRKLVNGKC